jgi:hypothetical protein
MISVGFTLVNKTHIGVLNTLSFSHIVGRHSPYLLQTASTGSLHIYTHKHVRINRSRSTSAFSAAGYCVVQYPLLLLIILGAQPGTPPRAYSFLQGSLSLSLSCTFSFIYLTWPLVVGVSGAIESALS